MLTIIKNELQYINHYLFKSLYALTLYWLRNVTVTAGSHLLIEPTLKIEISTMRFNRNMFMLTRLTNVMRYENSFNYALYSMLL